MAWVQPRHVPARQPAVRQLVRDDDVPRLAHGLATRARRPRPSEKTALRLSPGPSPLGHLTWEPSPLEGRAPHARKECWRFIGACALLVTGSSSTIRWKWNGPACVRPRNTGAETAPLRENRPSRHVGACLARPLCFGLALSRGGPRGTLGSPRNSSMRSID